MPTYIYGGFLSYSKISRGVSAYTYPTAEAGASANWSIAGSGYNGVEVSGYTLTGQYGSFSAQDQSAGKYIGTNLFNNSLTMSIGFTKLNLPSSEIISAASIQFLTAPYSNEAVEVHQVSSSVSRWYSSITSPAITASTVIFTSPSTTGPALVLWSGSSLVNYLTNVINASAGQIALVYQTASVRQGIFNATNAKHLVESLGINQVIIKTNRIQVGLGAFAGNYSTASLTLPFTGGGMPWPQSVGSAVMYQADPSATTMAFAQPGYNRAFIRGSAAINSRSVNSSSMILSASNYSASPVAGDQIGVIVTTRMPPASGSGVLVPNGWTLINSTSAADYIGFINYTNSFGRTATGSDNVTFVQATNASGIFFIDAITVGNAASIAASGTTNIDGCSIHTLSTFIPITVTGVNSMFATDGLANTNTPFIGRTDSTNSVIIYNSSINTPTIPTTAHITGVAPTSVASNIILINPVVATSNPSVSYTIDASLFILPSQDLNRPNPGYVATGATKILGVIGASIIASVNYSLVNSGTNARMSFSSSAGTASGVVYLSSFDADGATMNSPSVQFSLVSPTASPVKPAVYVAAGAGGPRGLVLNRGGDVGSIVINGGASVSKYYPPPGFDGNAYVIGSARLTPNSSYLLGLTASVSGSGVVTVPGSSALYISPSAILTEPTMAIYSWIDDGDNPIYSQTFTTSSNASATTFNAPVAGSFNNFPNSNGYSIPVWDGVQWAMATGGYPVFLSPVNNFIFFPTNYPFNSNPNISNDLLWSGSAYYAVGGNYINSSSYGVIYTATASTTAYSGLSLANGYVIAAGTFLTFMTGSQNFVYAYAAASTYPPSWASSSVNIAAQSASTYSGADSHVYYLNGKYSVFTFSRFRYGLWKTTASSLSGIWTSASISTASAFVVGSNVTSIFGNGILAALNTDSSSIIFTTDLTSWTIKSTPASATNISYSQSASLFYMWGAPIYNPLISGSLVTLYYSSDLQTWSASIGVPVAASANNWFIAVR